MNESTTTAIAYGLVNKISAERNVLAFDLGGSNVNITVLKIEEDDFKATSIASSTHLGGDDFVNRMVEYFVRDFKRKYNKDLQDSKRGLRQLRNACEFAKLTLSSSCQASIEIDSLHEDIDFYWTITRECCEELNADLFRSTIEPIEKALRDAKIDKASVHEIVLVGGSTRIPKVQQILQDFFNGFETFDGLMTAMMKRNTTITTKQTQTFPLTSFPKSQSGIITKLFEGERSMTKKIIIYLIVLNSGISSKSDDGSEIEVTFEIDANSILNVSSDDQTSAKSNKITITNEKERLSKDEIERMIADAEKYKKEDEFAEQEENEKKLKEVEKLCSSIMMKSSSGENDAEKISEGFSDDQTSE
ncbi:unnamed protein product [Rotaria sp. Silwood2]|nr:unnamed protein product [Rotaria sp. Silwood2]CAF4094402.1 unnamed protein product [Rotaria sp. Silwood2]